MREAKLIAEAWDACGAYQVGSFAERRWAEWNGRYRDDVRRFWRGDEGLLGAFASRITGSSDLYQGAGKGPERSINYVTSHDGFTLKDLVSYERKHNEPNGEGNEDGTDANYSHNYGVEGETADPEIRMVRRRQMKNFLLTLLVSRGVPMLLGGDEFCRTQQGNNNAYCQDNAISWYDWTRLGENGEMYRFARGMIAFRQEHGTLRRAAFYTDENVRWLGPDGGQPAWDDPTEKGLALLIMGEGADLLLMFNASTEATMFRLPEPTGGRDWRLGVDTSLRAPDDLHPVGEEEPVDGSTAYEMGPRSSAILVARSENR